MFKGVFDNITKTTTGSDSPNLESSLPGATPFNAYDPRPDLSNDSILWAQLLAAAEKVDYKLFGALRCMRMAGTGLVRTPEGKLRLWPSYIDPTGKTAWTSREEYDREKGELLDPVKDMLVQLLEKFSIDKVAA